MKGKLRNQLTNEGPMGVHANIARPNIVHMNVFHS